MGDTFDVSDITAESVKKWTPSVVCKWVVSTAMEEDIGKHFVEHSINGELLLRLEFADMNKLACAAPGLAYRPVLLVVCKTVSEHHRLESPRPRVEALA